MTFGEWKHDSKYSVAIFFVDIPKLLKEILEFFFDDILEDKNNPNICRSSSLIEFWTLWKFSMTMEDYSKFANIIFTSRRCSENIGGDFRKFSIYDENVYIAYEDNNIANMKKVKIRSTPKV